MSIHKGLRHVAAISSDVVRTRIDGHVKVEATNVLAGMSLSVLDAIRMLLTGIAADKALPFDINRVHAQPRYQEVTMSFCLNNFKNKKPRA